MAEKPAGIENNHWELVELMGEPVSTSTKVPFIKLDGKDKKVSGHLGCNNFSGSYTIDTNASRITFSNLISTKMACPDLSLEDGLNQALTTADNYSVNGTSMTLNKARMAPLARFELKK